MTKEEPNNKHLHKDEKIRKRFEKITKKTSLLYVRNGKKTIELDGRRYPLYKIDENGLPLKYTSKAFADRVKTDVDLIEEAIYVVKMISQGLMLYKAGIKPEDNELSLSGTSTFTYGDSKVEINIYTIGRIKDFVQKRLQEYPKIFNTTGTGTGHSKIRKMSPNVFGREWVEFLREAASRRILGTKEGEPANEDTDEKDLLFPSTKEGQKKKMPFLFGYAKGFKNLCVVSSDFMQRFLHYFFAINNCKNRLKDDKKYVRVEVDGKKVKITEGTFKLPEIMKKNLKNFLNDFEEKTNEKAKEQDGEAERTKQYYSNKYFASSLIFSISKGVNSDEVKEGKQAYKNIKDTEDGDQVLKDITDEQDLLTEAFDTNLKAREKARKEEEKEKPRKSTRKSKTRAEQKEENLNRED